MHQSSNKLMYNTGEPAGAYVRPPVRWTFGDIAGVVILSLITGVVLALGLGAGLAAAGGEPRALLRSNAVVFSALTGMAIYGIILLAVYLLIVRRRRVSWRTIGFRRPPLLAILLTPIVVVGQLMAAAIINLLVMRVTGSFENPQLEAVTGGQGFSWRNFGLMLLLVGIVAPIVEETFFRGVLYGWLRSRLPLFVAVLLSAAVFAAAHVIPILLPALFVVGVILALAYELSGSLWTSIALHMMQNSLVVVVTFAMLAFGLPTQS
jgi:membrane protease YdiL (CAAX protease family)